jgi:hypothetical protein
MLPFILLSAKPVAPAAASFAKADFPSHNICLKE